jgi:DNA-binding winged helix-turn-helix (wHTH) protein
VLLLSLGEVVSKDDIVRHVWPTTCVDESNLRFQMASLRKVLGIYRDAIKTIPGRGYLLASEWHAPEQPAG